MPSAKVTLYLIDGSTYIYRAFYGVRDLSTSTGLPTNAVYGFVGMLNRVLRERAPDYIAVALDAPGPTFRHELSSDYKANRPRMPEALSIQIPYIKRVISAYRVPCFEVPGYEADDIIGTLATWASGQGADVVMISGDKDLMQLVTGRVSMWDTLKNVVVGPAEVEKRYGIAASQLVELMGLMGDSGDNIPGVPGVGPKTAQRLIEEFGTIDNLLSDLKRVQKEKERKKLEEYSEQAILSRQLAKIECDVPVDRDWQNLKLGNEDRDGLITLYRELEFKKFLQEMEQEAGTVESAVIQRDHQLITTSETLRKIILEIRNSKRIALNVQSTGDDPMESELVGIGLAWEPAKGCYIPLGHLFESGPRQLDESEVMNELVATLEDPAIAKILHQSKIAWIVLKGVGVELQGLQSDTLLGAYVLDPGKRAQDLAVVAKEHLEETILSYEDLVGTGKKRRGFENVTLAQALAYAGDQAVACLRLAEILDEKIQAADQVSLFQDIELPLVRVLARMEMKGVRVDVGRLAQLAEDFKKRLEVSAEKIYALADEQFNINSPQQLGYILFEKLGLPMGKKTKTGYSTAMEVLLALAPHHPLPGEVLKYRSLMKLKSTYTDALPRMVSPKSGRIHTSYNQTATITGRLSSSEPNLQNIPVRTEEGRKIRRAFVAYQDYKLISADYSQIELRILAHYSEDEALIDSFQKGEDVHLRTAAEVFQIEPNEVTAELRRQAKTINFGIIYGMSAFRLARDLDIPQKSAREIIERYFERYKGVRSYVDAMPEKGRDLGYVTTLFNRKRFLPDLFSRNRNIRLFAERTAVNTPIQGSAADIIKLAMIQIDSALEQRGLPARMIMQVHDELVFEVKSVASEEVANLVKGKMESVTSLAVPLVAEVGCGDNWDEAH